MQQQMHQHGQPAHHSPGGGRALSPDPTSAAAYYFPPQHGPYAPQFPHHRSPYDSSSNQFLSPDLQYSGAASKLPFDHMGPFYPNNAGGAASAPPPATPQDGGKLLDNWPYPAAGQYQHLLVAN